MDSVERRVPGRFWYVVAAVLFICSIVAPAPIVLWNIFGQSEDVPRLIAPESKVFRLARGNYTVFSDSRAVINGEIVISQGSLSGLRVIVRSTGGREIPVEAVSIASRYNVAGQTGFGVLQFSIPEEGDYTISAEYREKSASNRALLSIRKDYLGGLFGSIVLAVFASLAGTFLAMAIFLRTLWKRRTLMMQGVRATIRNLGEGVQQAARRYTPPGSAEGKSPVQHQYDRDK